ncbi:hypothetical protein ACWEQL_36445 [Kitasatospora sp. NPDC004240]
MVHHAGERAADGAPGYADEAGTGRADAARLVDTAAGPGRHTC